MGRTGRKGAWQWKKNTYLVWGYALYGSRLDLAMLEKIGMGLRVYIRQGWTYHGHDEVYEGQKYELDTTILFSLVFVLHGFALDIARFELGGWITFRHTVGEGVKEGGFLYLYFHFHGFILDWAGCSSSWIIWVGGI